MGENYLNHSSQLPRSSQEWRTSLTNSQTQRTQPSAFLLWFQPGLFQGLLTLFTEMGICMMKITPAGLRFYGAWHGARKKRLHSQLLEFLNTNNILWDQWAGAGPPHPARLLRPQTSSDCAAGGRARPGVGGGGRVGWAGVPARAGAARGSTARTPGRQGATARPGPRVWVRWAPGLTCSAAPGSV